MEFINSKNYDDTSKNKFSKRVKNRLLLIEEYLKVIDAKRVSSNEIAAALHCKPELVRSDLRFVDFERGYRNGYSVEKLLEGVRRVLFQDDSEQCKRKCCIVGLGRLGAALLDESIFENSGFSVLCGFDSSVNRLEIMKSIFELFPASYIESICRSKKIEYAILCCAEKEAQMMVERLVKAGIKGIVNYTRAVIEVPMEVLVKNVSPVLALMEF